MFHMGVVIYEKYEWRKGLDKNLQEFGAEKKKIIELENKIKMFKKQWRKATTAKEQNDLLKTIVKRIFYNRERDNVTLEIEYL
ncbi:hypothetical protein [Desulfitobacterium sp. AusDCA]|uniref:hypothetical protein n=1 Tax=Desulfitobacterium sp. AusDCA TaxID=3240383 RepID=UPI003DA76062